MPRVCADCSLKGFVDARLTSSYYLKLLTRTLEHALSVQLEYYAPTLTEDAGGRLGRHSVPQETKLVGHRNWHPVILWKSHKAFAIED